MPSLKDIAKHANVSSCTVSRYLNKDIVVKKETEQRIQRAIVELGYVPNVVAKALKNNKTVNVAVILPKINNLYYSEMTSGISEVLVQQHYNLFIYEVENLHLSEEQIVQIMRENMVAGVIFIGMSYDMSFRKSLHRLLEWGVPVVYMNRCMSEDGYPLVYPDFYKAGELAAEHLYARGKKHIALLYKYQSAELLQAYTASFRRQFAGVEPLLLEIQDGEIAEAECIELLLQHKIDGVFVLNEMQAVRLTKALIKRGVCVPQNIAVMSFGSSLMSQISMPELTCIDLQNRELGKRSADIILRQINHEVFAPVTVLEPFIIEREST